jgi:hypothetical protein
VVRLGIAIAWLTGCGFQAAGGPVPPDGDGAVNLWLDGSIRDVAAGDVATSPSWVAIESLIVPATGAQVLSKTALANGVEYRLRATGTWVIQSNVDPPSLADAEWWNFSDPTTGEGLDVGLAIDDLALDDSKQPDWGPYNSTHEYEVTWTGDGSTISANIHDNNYGNDSGSLTLTILAWQ